MKINNNEIKMIIFDLDGTLLDSLKIWKDVDINFFAKRNLEMPSDYGQKIAHMGLEKASQYTKERFNLPESPEEILKEWEDAVYFEYANNVVLKDYAKEFLEICKANKLICSIATASQESCYVPCLKRNQIYGYFDNIINVLNYPEGKNSPQIYLDIAKKSGIAPNQILVIEDIVTALNSAKKGGFNVCAIYDETSSEEDTKRMICDVYIRSFKDLVKYMD